MQKIKTGILNKNQVKNLENSFSLTNRYLDDKLSFHKDNVQMNDEGYLFANDIELLNEEGKQLHISEIGTFSSYIDRTMEELLDYVNQISKSYN